MAGETPSVPVSFEELERQAEEAMERAGRPNYVSRRRRRREDTMHANREAFRRRRIVPADAARRRRARPLDRRCSARAMPAPLMLAPIGVQKVVHAEGELATARAAAAVGVPMIASTASHFTLEEIAEAGGEAPRWFQLYWPNDRGLLESFVGRAEAAGYGAIVVTVDAFIPGWKPRDLQQAWLPFLEGMGDANYIQDPVFRAGLEKTPEEDLGAATGPYLGVLAEPVADLGRPGLAARADLAADPRQGDPARRRRPRGGAARPRRHRRLQPRRPPGRRRDRPRSTRWRRSPRRSATSWRSSSTAASAAAPTCSRRSRSAPTRSASAAPTSGAWLSTARTASKRC